MEQNNHQKRILVLRCGALGDLVYSTSVISALIEKYGDDVVIDFITSKGSASLFKCDTRVNKVFVLKGKKFPLWLNITKRRIVEHSKKNPYDVYIALELGKQFEDLSAAIKADKKTGMLYNKNLIDSKINREISTKKTYSDVIPWDILKVASPTLMGSVGSGIGLDTIVISASNSHVKRSGINHRLWSDVKWVSLIKELVKDNKVVMIGAKGEESFFESLKPYPNNVINLVGKLSIPELITVLGEAKALVCTDSASGHIAAAMGTKTFVLMGPNSIVSDSPYCNKQGVVNPISLEMSCAPCYNTPRMKECLNNECMKDISVGMVINKMRNSGIEV